MYQKAGIQRRKSKYNPHGIDENAGRGKVTFEITETPKVKIEDVVFRGRRGVLAKEAAQVIKTRRHWMFSWLTGKACLKDEQLDEDKEKLAEFYRDEGYIDFELKDVRYVYETPRKLVLHFVISEGSRIYRVGAVDFKGPRALFNSRNEMPEQAEDGGRDDLHPNAACTRISRSFRTFTGRSNGEATDRCPVFSAARSRIRRRARWTWCMRSRRATKSVHREDRDQG